MNSCLAESDVHQTTVRFRGELDIATVGQVRGALARAVAADDTVLVDLGAVTFVDAATVGVLLTANAEARLMGQRVVLCELSPRVRRVLNLLGVEREFEIVP